MQVKEIEKQNGGEVKFGDNNATLRPNVPYAVRIVGAEEMRPVPNGNGRMYPASVRVFFVEGAGLPNVEAEAMQASIDPRAFQPLLYSELQKRNAMTTGMWYQVQYSEGQPRMSRNNPGTMWTPRNWNTCIELGIIGEE